MTVHDTRDHSSSPHRPSALRHTASRRQSRALAGSLLLPLLCSAATAQIWEACNLRDTYSGEAPGDWFGWVGRDAGDVDGDGVTDIVVGARAHGTGGQFAGRAYVYSAASTALLFTLDGTTGQALGTDVGPAGDVNGDGWADVIVGAPGGNGPGDAYVLLGPSGTLHLHLVGSHAGDQFGATVNTAFDVNGDGYDDVIVGAPSDDSSAANAGKVYVFSGLDGALLYTHDGEAAGAAAGSAVGPIGDADHDGLDDYLYGANGAAGGVGRAYVHRGVDGSQRCVLDADATGVDYGHYFCGWVGDVDADGTPDFFVSDWSNAALGAGTGRAYVYSGADCSVLHTLTGTKAGQGLGIGRGWAGDYDGDGHDDLFFGSWVADEGGTNAGKGTLFSGASGERLAVWTGNQPGANLGFDAAGLGDVDGDGWADFVLTAAALAGNTGAAYVVTGGPDLPQAYCPGQPNSTGAPATLEYRRSVSLAANEFRLRVEDAIPNELAVAVYGAQRTLLPFGDGTLCVGGQLFRLPPVTLNANGSRFVDVDFTTGPPSQGAGQITAGSSWFFQAWYRDPAGAAGSNLTNGLRVTFCQ